MMKIHKKIAGVFAAMVVLASTSLTALAVAPGYSDYGASDTAQVTPGQAVGQLVAPTPAFPWTFPPMCFPRV